MEVMTLFLVTWKVDIGSLCSTAFLLTEVQLEALAVVMVDPSSIFRLKI